MNRRSSDVSVVRSGIVNANVMLPSGSLDTTTCVMSAAPPTASPVGSVNVAAAVAPVTPKRSSASTAARRNNRLLKGPLLRSRTQGGYLRAAQAPEQDA